MIKYRAMLAFITLVVLAWVGVLGWAFYGSFGWWGPVAVVAASVFVVAFVWAVLSRDCACSGPPD